LEAAGKPTDLKQLTQQCATDAHGTTLEALQRVAELHGLKTEAAQVDAEFLKQERPRGIAWVEGVHYLCFQPRGDQAELWDPNGETTQTLTWEQLTHRSQGIVLLTAGGNAQLPKL
jgi:ABC-type bacteriocin/lantibiotic exporter with double-glycine peptidase domain